MEKIKIPLYDKGTFKLVKEKVNSSDSNGYLFEEKK